jgi:hypothetical protein
MNVGWWKCAEGRAWEREEVGNEERQLYEAFEGPEGR